MEIRRIPLLACPNSAHHARVTPAKRGREKAILNGVADRVVTGSLCTADTLKSFPFSGKGLILSDCEGFEKELFAEDVVPFLAEQDLLVEVHDFIDIEISSLLGKRFQGTHTVESIQSVDDITKAHSYVYEELEGFDLAIRKVLLGETRPSITEWFYMTPRAQV